MNTLKFAIYLLFSVAFIVLVYFLYLGYQNWRRTKEMQENLYDMKYLWMKDAIYHWPVTEANYHTLRSHFCKINMFEHKDKEKTDVLFREFIEKFREVAR
jgi:hypothetical protein